MKTRVHLSFAVALAFALVPFMRAQDVDWTGASGDPYYRNPANWNPARVPGSGGNSSDNAWFQQTTGVAAQLSGPAPSVNSLLIGGTPGGSAATLNILAGSSINAGTLTAGQTNNAPGRLNMSGGLLTAGNVYSGGLAGGVGTIDVSGGLLSVTNTGGFRVAWGNGVANDTSGSSLAISGSGIAVSSYGVSVGGPSGDASYNDSGTVSVSDSGGLYWSDNFTLKNGSALSIQGSGPTIVGSGSGNALSLLGTDTIEFILDSTGVATVDLDNNGGMLNLSPTSVLSIDGAGYTGPSVTLTLIAHGGYSGSSVFGTENFFNFSSEYSPSILYAPDSVQVILDRIPEPSGMALILLGGVAFGFVRGRKIRSA